MAIVNTIRRCLTLPRRYRLRTLLLVISAVALLCGWQVERVHRRARAGELITRWGLWIAEEESTDGGLLWRLIPDSAQPRILRWRTNRIGVSSFPLDPPGREWTDSIQCAATGRILWGGVLPCAEDVCGASPAERRRLVAAIAEFTELRLLDLGFPLDDDDLRALSGLRALECLSLNVSALSDAGVRSLQRFRMLLNLELSFEGSGPPSVASIAALSKLPYLERLYIDPVSDETFAEISAVLPRVQVSHLWPEEAAAAGR